MIDGPILPISPGVKKEFQAVLDILPTVSRVVEIGSHLGIGSTQLLAKSPNVEAVLCIDPYKYPSEQEIDFYRFKSFMRNTQAYNSKVSIIMATADNVAKFFPSHWFDLVFVDGEHDYFSVSRDINAWWPKIKMGGLMCGDDMEMDSYDPEFINQDYVNGCHHGVVKAVTEFAPNNYERRGLFWLIRKRKDQ